jgi:hypothetical protein
MVGHIGQLKTNSDITRGLLAHLLSHLDYLRSRLSESPRE